MKVKVGNTIYDSEHVPVMVILNDEDKRRICNMREKDTRYARVPDGYFETYEAVEQWMKNANA